MGPLLDRAGACTEDNQTQLVYRENFARLNVHDFRDSTKFAKMLCVLFSHIKR